MNRIGIVFGLSLIGWSSSLAQTGPPTMEILTRVTEIRSPKASGSVFSIDVDNREYWITAKHVLTGAAHPPYGSIDARSVTVQVRKIDGPGIQWITVQFSVLDPGKDIDIVAGGPSLRV